MNTTIEIIPCQLSRSYKQGSLFGLTREDIESKLGKSNARDDESKVRWSWGFTVNGEECGVWDWKGGADRQEWSYFGPSESLALVFGKEHVT